MELLLGRFSRRYNFRNLCSRSQLSAKEKAGVWELLVLPTVLSSCPLREDSSENGQLSEG